MTIHWPLFIAAIVLLCFPPSLMFASSTKRRLSHEREAGDFNILRGMLAWQNWVDLLRGYAGGYLLFEKALTPPEDSLWMVWVLGGAVLAVALLFQTIRRHHGRGYFLAPIFFVWGIIAYLTDFLANPTLLIYGLAVGILFATMTKNAEWQLPAMAVVIAAIGYFISGLSIQLVLVGAVGVWPLVITFCGRGHMVFLMRSTRATAS